MADIELVIKISSYDKEWITNGYYIPEEINMRISEAIANGTPLPKGHGNLIDVNRKVTVSTYDEQYEEWGAETLTVLEVLNKWSDEGVTAKDVIIQADKESEGV